MTKLPRDEQITDANCVTCGFPFDTDEPCSLVTKHYEPACSRRCATQAEETGHGALLPVDIAWIDDNDGCGPRKLQNSIRCF